MHAPVIDKDARRKAAEKQKATKRRVDRLVDAMIWMDPVRGDPRLRAHYRIDEMNQAKWDQADGEISPERLHRCADVLQKLSELMAGSPMAQWAQTSASWEVQDQTDMVIRWGRVSFSEIDELVHEMRRLATIASTYDADMARWKEKVGL
jgi:hypothetical protein